MTSPALSMVSVNLNQNFLSSWHGRRYEEIFFDETIWQFPSHLGGKMLHWLASVFENTTGGAQGRSPLNRLSKGMLLGPMRSRWRFSGCERYGRWEWGDSQNCSKSMLVTTCSLDLTQNPDWVRLRSGRTQWGDLTGRRTSWEELRDPYTGPPRGSLATSFWQYFEKHALKTLHFKLTIK